MNRTFKVIGKHPFTHRQQKKRVYTSFEDYEKYSDQLTDRYKGYLDVEHYELIDGSWCLLKQVAYEGGCTWRNGYKY